MAEKPSQDIILEDPPKVQRGEKVPAGIYIQPTTPESIVETAKELNASLDTAIVISEATPSRADTSSQAKVSASSSAKIKQ